MAIDIPTKPRPRLLRFSLRGLLLVMLLVCVAMGWKVQRARTQQKAVAWVQETGGRVIYDYEFDDNEGVDVDAKPPGPDWLRGQLVLGGPVRSVLGLLH